MSEEKNAKMYDNRGIIKFITVLSDTIYHIGIECPEISAECRAGQFVMIRVDRGYDPLLRRPFSICRSGNDGIIEIVYKVVGKGTRLLSEKDAGSEIDVLGPLGNSFDLDAEYDSYVFVNGGMGFPPLAFLAEELHKRSKKTVFYYGALSVNDLIYKNEIERLCGTFVAVTEDGSSGRKGLVTDVFLSDIREGLIGENTAVISCGPLLMLKRMCSLSKEYGFHLEVSLENEMACGIGICQGCAVKVADKGEFGYKLVCKDGPVFNARELLWDE